MEAAGTRASPHSAPSTTAPSAQHHHHHQQQQQQQNTSQPHRVRRTAQVTMWRQRAAAAGDWRGLGTAVGDSVRTALGWRETSPYGFVLYSTAGRKLRLSMRRMCVLVDSARAVAAG